jgi:hypothetical protein
MEAVLDYPDVQQKLNTRKATSPAKPFVIPDGYMTGDEFERRVKARVTQFYKDHGLI